ncbi:TatD family hydrolase, partial [Peribacillus sp. NPDC056705]|uniref:TatD family hydrolase n=1 Tax=Peribacillus sp. NPDC056705 TaxID=3345918 RepID=UPI003748BF7B
LASCKRNLELGRVHGDKVRPAFGYHPEQPLLSSSDLKELLEWMEQHVDEMIAVGEIGLPYYNRIEAEAEGRSWDNRPYEAMLEQFIMFAKKFHKPVILHAVYEDADIACRLLEKHDVTHAHFHWFKGSRETLGRMARNGYYISFTPDILYEEEIREIARSYPEHLVMSETDGPWPFEGPFADQMTHPEMTAAVATAWAELKGMSETEARQRLYDNAVTMYGL